MSGVPYLVLDSLLFNIYTCEMYFDISNNILQVIMMTVLLILVVLVWTRL